MRAEFLREKPAIGDMENEFKSIDEENRWSPLYGVSMGCVYTLLAVCVSSPLPIQGRAVLSQFIIHV